MKFYVTFGQRYRVEPHPYLCHPDAFTEVQAETYEHAREKVITRYGTQWAFIYGEAEFDKSLYPRGRGEVII